MPFDLPQTYVSLPLLHRNMDLQVRRKLCPCFTRRGPAGMRLAGSVGGHTACRVSPGEARSPGERGGHAACWTAWRQVAHGKLGVRVGGSCKVGASYLKHARSKDALLGALLMSKNPLLAIAPHVTPEPVLILLLARLALKILRAEFSAGQLARAPRHDRDQKRAGSQPGSSRFLQESKLPATLLRGASGVAPIIVKAHSAMLHPDVAHLPFLIERIEIGFGPEPSWGERPRTTQETL